ncbi:MAG: hypothetical protein IJM90_07235 [Firmicutes bacterium]|nr:hypothetical protein [Bacillota bacterium]
MSELSPDNQNLIAFWDKAFSMKDEGLTDTPDPDGCSKPLLTPTTALSAPMYWMWFLRKPRLKSFVNPRGSSGVTPLS